jgi:PEP-CTERM motif
VSGFANGLGFQSMEFTIAENGVEVLDVTFGSLAIAESFFRDDVIDLGANLGPSIDLTFGTTLIADGRGGFGFDLAIGGAVPEPSTWAMMLVGLAGLGFAGYRSTRRRAAFGFGASARESSQGLRDLFGCGTGRVARRAGWARGFASLLRGVSMTVARQQAAISLDALLGRVPVNRLNDRAL